jgi:acid stress chaperone HdeB
MKKLAAIALFGLFSAQMATAETVDVSTITCADLAAMPVESISMLLTWIDGYMGGAATDATFDVERLQANIDGATAACATDPTATLMSVLQTAENG